MSNQLLEQVTPRLVEFASTLEFLELPDHVGHEFTRSFVDSIGCIVGGSRHAAVSRATETLGDFFGKRKHVLCGQGRKADILHAPLLNGLAGASYSYFDSYSSAHLHAGVVHAAALLAVAERSRPTGSEFMSAYAAGIEIACRLTQAIAVPPAKADIGWSIGGIVSSLSTALAAARLLGLDRQRSTYALGIAASGASGTRAEQGAMTAGLIYGQAAQIGVRAALLASGGFTSSTRSVEATHGWARMFSNTPNLGATMDELGETFEGTSTTYKPYPTDIAIHPSIDAVLRLRERHHIDSDQITRITLAVSNLAATFCDRPKPADELEAKFSLQHWVAVAASGGQARLQEGRLDIVMDPEIERIRGLIELSEEPSLEWDAAKATVEFSNGLTLVETVDHCLGSPKAPMTDDLLTAKFVDQAELAIGRERATELASACWRVASLPDASALAQLAC